MNTLVIVLALLAVFWFLAYHRLAAPVWTLVVGIGLVALTLARVWPQPVLTTLWLAFAVAALLLNPTPVRRVLISAPLLVLFRKILPQVSQTEQEALAAGTVWWDGDLFSGRPDWKKLLAYPKPTLSAEEKAFLEGPVEELCAMLDDWKITHELNDLPPHVWQFIKE